jgi:energy-coupling factor transporter ATP-binding protein EcfA2
MIKCGKLNKCGYEESTRDRYPEAFGKFNERFPSTTEDPNATADAFLIHRGIPLDTIKGHYRQGEFRHKYGNRKTATVVFDIADGVWMERLIEPVTITEPDKDPDVRKAHFHGSHKGMFWKPPGLDLTGADEVWIVEGCIDALSLYLHGIPAVAILSAGNYPYKLLDQLNPHKTTLVWALDNDKAGNDYTRKHIDRAAKRKDGIFESRAALIPQGKYKQDWNDVHIAARMSDRHIKNYRYHGDLFLAPSAMEKGLLIHLWTRQDSFAFVFENRTYWWELSWEKHSKLKTTDAALVEKGHPETPPKELARQASDCKQIANCKIEFLYFQENLVTGESWYYARVSFPHGAYARKNTFNGAQITASGTFKQRLATFAPGAMWTGAPYQLDWIVLRHLDGIKIVDTVDFVGYDKASGIYVYPDKAVSKGKVYDLNDEDFFEVGKTNIKTLNRSVPIIIGSKTDYKSEWVNKVYTAFGAKGIIAAAFWFGSLFAEQIREQYSSFPFLEITGAQGSGKTTLIMFLQRLIGRPNEEGTDPLKASMVGLARKFSQTSNMPFCLIEGDRSGVDMQKAKQFDFDSLKDMYNGRPLRTTGMKTGGNETNDPLFKSTVVISQNAKVKASEAIISRIIYLHFTKDHHSDEGRHASEYLENLGVEDLSYFLILALQNEKNILESFSINAPKFIKKIQDDGRAKEYRIFKNHGHIMAWVTCLAQLTDMPRSYVDEAHKMLLDCAAERQESCASEHPIVVNFWEAVEYLGNVDHSKNPEIIAINLNHFIKRASEWRQEVPSLVDLKKHLKESRMLPFIDIASVSSKLEYTDEEDGLGNTVRTSKTVKCWRFDARQYRKLQRENLV